MTEYFFHFMIDGEERLAATSVELENVAEARLQALQALAETARDRVAAKSSGRLEVRITSQDGKTLGVVGLMFDEVPPDWGSIKPG
jgi:hypothetical protein